MIKPLVVITVLVLLSFSITNADALRQVAGKIIVDIKPGESNSFEWGLVSDKPNEITSVELSAEGDGAEFLSFEKTLQIPPTEIVYVPITVNIPPEYPGGIELQPHLIATEFGEQGGATVINIRMLKIVNLNVSLNDDSSLWVDWGEIKKPEVPETSAEQTAPQTTGGEGLTITKPETDVEPEPEVDQEPMETEKGGGCLIATATFGSELAPQVQLLREIRDGKVLQTESGSAFMKSFNTFYYSFSPTIADWERENSAFRETVKLSLTPLLTSLAILNYVDINSEHDILTYGIGIILLNIGMYFVAPAILISRIFAITRKS